MTVKLSQSMQTKKNIFNSFFSDYVFEERNQNTKKMMIQIH